MAASHDKDREVRDPVYDFVRLSEAEWEVVNTPEFDRLRDIRQLAMGHLVYPGANHTRFEHSLGAVHLSTLLFDTLLDQDRTILESEFGLTSSAQERARQVLRLAAMLHDIGHAPYSHSGEHLMPISEGDSKQISHEEMSARIIRESAIGELIEKEFGPQGISAEEVIGIATDFRYARDFNPQPFHQFLHDLLAGELGSDRIDYLLRDAYHSGQRSGLFDYRRLVGCVRLVPPPKEAEPGYRIGFDSGGWLVAEQMIVARYLMYQSLYFHKTKRIFEKHLEGFLKDWLTAEYGVPHLPIELEKYLGLSDSRVWTGIMCASADPLSKGHEHAKRFTGRSQMRVAKELILVDNHFLAKTGRRVPLKRRFDKLVEDVRIKFGSSVACDQPDHSATKMFDDTHKILVILDNQPRYLDDVSEIVRGMSDKIWRGRVYAEPQARDEVHDWCDEWLAAHPADKSFQ